MSKELKHGLDQENLMEFHKELTELLKKFSVHPDGTAIEIKTHNLKFKSNDIANCRPECIRRAEVCDHNGEHCHWEVWCECDE